MKGYSITADKKIEPVTKEATAVLDNCAKVRIVKAGIDDIDINLFKKSLDYPIIPSKQGVGVISEIAENNAKNLKKGDKVFINPYLPCGECLQCKTGSKNICSDMKVMGKNSDGLLRDFVNMPISNLTLLPEQVADNDALFVADIALAIEILSSLKIEKGDYVVISGANALGNILAQLVMYYHAVPIVLDLNEKNIKAAKQSGVYYTIPKDDDAKKIINQITGGRLAKYVVYVSGCGYDVQRAAELCVDGGTLCLCDYLKEDLKIDLNQILKRNIRILSFNNGFNQFSAALNILATKSVAVTKLIIDIIKFNDVQETFQKYSDNLDAFDMLRLVVDTLT